MSNKLEGITLQAEGEANCYRMMRGGNWLASIRMNGELLVWDQEAILNAMLSSGKPAADPVQDIARQLVIQTFGDGLLAKIRQTVDLLQEAAAERDQLREEVERLEDALETETMRLVACGVAALGYFQGCAEEYDSASLRDVLALRAQLAQQQGVPGAAVCTTDCRSPDGISVGIIDAMITLARLFKGAEVTPAVAEALLDLRSDEDLISMLASPAPVQAETASPWVAVSERLPESERTVLAYYLDSHNKGRRIRAEYIAAKTKGADDGWDEEYTAEYDEETDQYFWPAGWYEVMDNWDGLTHVAVVEGDVTHWMPLPAGPEVAP